VNQTHSDTHRSARTAIVGASIGLVVVLLAVVIFANTSSAGAPTRPAAGEASQIAALQAQFALLRGPATTSPPAALTKALAKAPATYGLDLAAARRAAATNAWLVPGDGWVCIAANDADGLGVACTSSKSAEAGELTLVERSPASGEEHIIGAAPDGHSTISAVGADSTPLASGAVRENTYTITVRNAARIAMR
jgi:hypothetical protein